MYRKNVASQFIHFQGVDSATGGIKSGVTWTVRRCLDGTFAAATGTASEDGTTGWYKFALSQADTNGNNCAFNFTGTGAVPQTVNFVTTACDPTVATNFGITSLPTTAVTTNGSLITSGTGTAQLSVTSGRALSDVDTIKTNPVVNAGTITFPTTATLASTTNITAGTLTTVTTATNVTTVNGLAANVITAAATAADFGAEIADAVWDEVLTGGEHNIATSAGRRLRTIQDNQSYDDGAIWIDTVNGTAGTTLYENGTAGLPVDTLADALTLAAAANLKHFHLINGSSITLTSNIDSYEITGDEFGVALGGQSVNGASIHNAHKVGVGVSGTFTGNPHILHSMIDTAGITGPNARLGWCAIMGPLTSNGTGTWVVHSCWGLSGAVFDFGAGAGQTIYILDWLGGPIEIKNMAASDVLYFEGRSGLLTLAASCTAGTVILAGNIALTNNGSGQTLSQKSRYELTRILSDSTAFQGADIAAILTDTGTTLDTNITAIKAKTDSLAFTVAGQVDSNVQYVNDIEVTGDGQTGTEWGPV